MLKTTFLQFVCIILMFFYISSGFCYKKEDLNSLFKANSLSELEDSLLAINQMEIFKMNCQKSHSKLQRLYYCTKYYNLSKNKGEISNKVYSKNISNLEQLCLSLKINTKNEQFLDFLIKEGRFSTKCRQKLAENKKILEYKRSDLEI